MSKKNTPSKEISTEKKLTALKKRRVLSAVFTASVIVAVVLLNVIAGILTERFGLEADVTDAGLYTLSEKTENYIGKTLKTDISITVLSPEKTFSERGTYYRQICEILKKMAQKSPRVELKFTDINKDPALASKYSGEAINGSCIIVENKQNGRHRVLNETDYFNLSDETAMMYYYYYGYAESYIEQAAVSAMLYVCDETPPRAAFAAGFNESDSTALKSLLSKNGYEAETLDLLRTEKIDPDIDFVVLYAPVSDYDKATVKRLSDYLENGGEYGKTVLYFASTAQPKTPNIDAFLEEWGISVGFSVIGQTNADHRLLINGAQTAYAHLQQAADTKYASGFDGANVHIMGADLRPVYASERTQNELEILLSTYTGAFLFPLDAGEDYDFSKAETGVFADIIMSTRTVSEGKRSRLCAIGSDQLSGHFLSFSNASNAEFFLSVFDSISGKSRGIVISPKSVTQPRFDMSEADAKTLLVILSLVLPALIISGGIAVYIRRRRR